MRENTCRNCTWFRKDMSSLPEGECMVNPPTLNSNNLSVRPITNERDYCAKFRNRLTVTPIQMSAES